VSRLLLLLVLAQQPSWLTWDAATKTATIAITAGSTPANSKWNFNGASHGDMTITVPLGAKVIIDFTNNDAGNAHSVGVVVPKEPVPASGDGMTFLAPTAYSVPFTRGSPRGKSEKIEFKAEKAGSYWLFCGVPPHGSGGMYVQFEVSAKAKVPSVVSRKP
jgi:sulfocyanin